MAGCSECRARAHCEDRLGGGRLFVYGGSRVAIEDEKIEQCPVKLGKETAGVYINRILVWASKQRILNQLIVGETG
jgi:hypothetical protein